MLGQGRINAFWWRCRLNWRRELPRTQRLSCLNKRRGSFSWRGGRWARGGMSMTRFAPCVGRFYQNLSTGPPWQMGLPDFKHEECERAPNSVIIPTKCNRHRRYFMPMQPKILPNSPEFTCQCNPHLSRFRSIFLHMQPTPPELLANSTFFCAKFVRITFKCNPNCVPNSVNIPSTCNPNRPNFMPTSVVERQTKKERVWRCTHGWCRCGGGPHT